MAGNYALQITFSGVLGANTPINLMIQSAQTDVTRTYGYGDVLHSAAGVTSSIYIQTRDGYGNDALVDPTFYPTGTEDIVFELCYSVKEDPTKACAGGVQELGVSVTLSYGADPSGSTNVFFGLYTLSYFPFSDGKYLPLVRHNDTIVECLFDTSTLAQTQDPGPAVADACILQKQIASASSSETTRRVIYSKFLPSKFQNVEFGAAHDGRRLSGLEPASSEMVINATFKEPDLNIAQRWSLLAPILAAIVGLLADICCGYLIPSLHARYNRLKQIRTTDTRNAVESRKAEPALHDVSDGQILQQNGANAFVFVSDPTQEQQVPSLLTTKKAMSYSSPQTTFQGTTDSDNDPVWSLTSSANDATNGSNPWVSANSLNTQNNLKMERKVLWKGSNSKMVSKEAKSAELSTTAQRPDDGALPAGLDQLGVSIIEGLGKLQFVGQLSKTDR